MKSQNSANKPKLGQGRESLMQAQVQVQIKEENQIRDQIFTKQKEGLKVPLTKQTTVRHIEQDLENDKIPKHINKHHGN